MSELEKLEKEFEAKKKTLQEACLHLSKTEWIEHCWAFGHSADYCVKLCERCGKVLEQKDHSEIPIQELPFLALPSDIRLEILKLTVKEAIALAEATQKFWQNYIPP